MRCQWCCILEPAWMLSTGGDWVMHIAVVFIFSVEILEFSNCLETVYGLFQLSRKALKALRKTHPRFHQSLPLGHISQAEALVSSRILCFPSLNSTALISFPPCCVEEEKGELSPRPLLKLKPPSPVGEREPSQCTWSQVHLVERALLPMCMGTGVNNVHQDIGFSELDCIILCFEISLVLLNQQVSSAERMYNAGRVTKHVLL